MLWTVLCSPTTPTHKPASRRILATSTPRSSPKTGSTTLSEAMIIFLPCKSLLVRIMVMISLASASPSSFWVKHSYSFFCGSCCVNLSFLLYKHGRTPSKQPSQLTPDSWRRQHEWKSSTCSMGATRRVNTAASPKKRRKYLCLAKSQYCETNNTLACVPTVRNCSVRPQHLNLCIDVAVVWHISSATTQHL